MVRQAHHKPTGSAPLPLALLCNFALLYLLYMLCRVVYVWEFWDLYADDWPHLSKALLLAGSLRFDSSAIFYTNSLYALLVLLPLPRQWTDSKGYRLATKCLFVAVNMFMLVINLVDTVYSRYTGRRTTWTFFSEFSNEGNLGSIVGIELLHHWYLVLIGLLVLAALLFLYRPVNPAKSAARHYLGRSIGLLLFVPLSIIAMRGGATTSTRPITISNANQYVDRPSQAAIVLNTPFSLIRTCGKTAFTDPAYFPQSTLDTLYTPVHRPLANEECPSTGFAHSSPKLGEVPHRGGGVCPSILNSPNVVVLIIESMAAEYMGFYNDYPGYTPFLDSLAAHSLTFTHAFSNGRKSIDAMPSILSGIPMFVEPFVLTPYSLNRVSGIAGELAKVGYTTSFYHGAANGSMGFEAFARTSGFAHYYGRNEYNADPRFGGDSDFDGTWAIWDEPFLQFFALSLSETKQPFMAALFTASSHHPFRVPDSFLASQDNAPTPGHPMYTCIRYTDYALRRFFETASRQPWFENTLFVITADHTNHSEVPAYQDALGPFRVPIIFYDPSGRLPRGRYDCVAQQTDIMPTLLGALAYPNPYIAYGVNLLATPPDSTWAVHYDNGIYQYVREDYLLTFDGEKARGLYHIPSDPFQKHNLINAPGQQSRARHYTRHLQAIIQSYMQRMISDSLTGSTSSP